MTDTLFDDWAEFQPVVDDTYTHPFGCFRSNDGIHRDHHFADNLKWAMGASKHRVKNLLTFHRFRRLVGFLVYFVWEPDGGGSVATLKSQLGRIHRPRMAVVLDVESWGGKITGDHSAEINSAREDVIRWLHSLRPSWQQKTAGLRRLLLRRDRKRVVGYANAGDFANIWPSRGDTNVIVANYSFNPTFPRKLAHQYTDNAHCAPFGHNDENSADGYTTHAFAVALGLTGRKPLRRNKPRHKPTHRPHHPILRPGRKP